MRGQTLVWMTLVVAGMLAGTVEGCASGEETPPGGDDDDSSSTSQGGAGGSGASGAAASGGTSTGGAGGGSASGGMAGSGGAACTPDCQPAATAAECCSGVLNAGYCVAGACGVTGAACDCPAECCSNACNGGVCGCEPDGSQCQIGSECCSGNCSQGICAGACAIQCGANCCKAGEQCCGAPSFLCTCANCMCPISRAVYKKDIRYLRPEDERRMRDELLAFPLAEYQYRHEDDDAPHLGFIIDDVEPSRAAPGGESVDLYAYTTMAVAALKEQQREIDALRKEVDRLKRSGTDHGRPGPVHEPPTQQ